MWEIDVYIAVSEVDGWTREWHDPEGRNMGMSIGDFHGEGIFPVYVKRGSERQISELKIDFSDNRAFEGADMRDFDVPTDK